jgi:hypothetical protein
VREGFQKPDGVASPDREKAPALKIFSNFDPQMLY